MTGPRRIDKPLILYGYGRLGHLAEEIFKELKVPIQQIIDKTIIWNLTPDAPKSLVAVCVATEPFNYIKEYLLKAGYEDIISVWDIIEAYPEIGIHNGWFAEDLTSKDIEEMRRLQWDDIYSKIAYLCFWTWHKQRIELSEYSIMPFKESLSSTLADIRARQKVRLWSNSHITFADIHAEGKELETIEANMEVFKKRRPNLSVSCYHSRDGLWKIEKTLMDNLPDYRWTFRLHAYSGQAAYIYGMPLKKL